MEQGIRLSMPQCLGTNDNCERMQRAKANDNIIKQTEKPTMRHDMDLAIYLATHRPKHARKLKHRSAEVQVVAVALTAQALWCLDVSVSVSSKGLASVLTDNGCKRPGQLLKRFVCSINEPFEQSRHKHNRSRIVLYAAEPRFATVN